MSRKHTYIVLPLLLLLNACSTTTPGPHQTPLTGPAPVEKQVVIPEMDDESRFAELERLENEGYLPPTLGRGDVLDISVYDEPDLTIEEIPIRPDGRISFPLIGDVQAEGLTVSELNLAITEGLARFLLAPKVSVIVQEFNSQQYTIFGEVVEPGVYPLTTEVTITKALAGAGGLNRGNFRATTVELADLTHAFIARQGEVLPVDFVQLVRFGDLRYDISLQPGDYIYIPSGLSKEVYILGEVNNPMLFAFREDMSVTRTLAQAEGFTPDADLKRIHIIRGSLHNPTVYMINYRAVMEGEAREIALEPGDIVYVPPTGLTSFSRAIDKIIPAVQALQVGIILADTARDGTVSNRRGLPGCLVRLMPGLRSIFTAALLAISCCGSAQLMDGHVRWSSESRLGVTSGLDDCSPQTGCERFPDAFPFLYVQLVSARALTIGLDADATDPSVAESIRLYAMSVEKRAVPLSIEKSGYSRTVVGFDARDEPLIERRLHLLLHQPLVAGLSYRFESAVEPSQRIVFTVPDNPVSPSIQVNQVGYLPEYAKVAFVGNWLGTAGPLPVDGREFEVLETDSGRLVHKGNLVLVSERDSWSGNKVLRADFSEIDTPGRYQLQVPGIGRSYSFEISESVFQPVYRRLFRLFYHSRNSAAIIAPWADSGWERPGGIPGELNAFFHESVGVSPLGHGEKPYGYHPVDRGWFDAGDYGQYVVNAAPVWFSFGAGIDISANAFASDNLGIPESNNGIPDVIDELEWGMAWLLSMQDSEDGGVYNRVAPLLWDDSMPHAVDSPRYLFEKTTHATASFAAATAIHARLLRPWKPKQAQLVLAASRAAWKFLGNSVQWPKEGDVYHNPVGVHAGEYPDSSAIDNSLWAAAELYRATGEGQFLDAFIAILEKFQPDPTAGVSFKEQGLAAYWAMFLALEPGVTSVDVSASEKANRLRDGLSQILLSAADWYLRKVAENPFNAPMHQHKPYTGWGSFGQSSRAVLPLLQAWTISKDDKYLERASEMSNPQLGANPQSICYITGTGSKSPSYPLSKLSQLSRGGLPMNGIPINGPHYHLPALWPSTRAVNQAYLPAEEAHPPDGYPSLRRYVDSDLLPPMSEPTVAEYAAVAVAFGLLSDGTFMYKANP